jgi:hypothetical protein
MLVQDGFLYLKVTRHKLTVKDVMPLQWGSLITNCYTADQCVGILYLSRSFISLANNFTFRQ